MRRKLAECQLNPGDSVLNFFAAKYLRRILIVRGQLLLITRELVFVPYVPPRLASSTHWRVSLGDILMIEVIEIGQKPVAGILTRGRVRITSSSAESYFRVDQPSALVASLAAVR